MTKIHTAVLVLLALVVSVVAVADEVQKCEPFNLDLGTFSSTDGGYFAWTAAVSQDPWCAYLEVDMKSDYDLFIGTWRFDARGDKAVVRVDDGKVRVGAFAPLAAGFSARLIAGDGPTRLDLWTPSAPLGAIGDAKFCVSGWVRAHENNPPDWWVCPTMSWGNLSVQYEYNLRRDGGDFICTNYRISWQ